MAKQNLNIGSSANDGTGDSLRDGAIKLNSVIDELYTNLGNNTNLQINVGTPSTGQLLKWNGAQFAEGNFDAFSSDVDVNGNKIVSTAFNQRRKMLKNSMKSWEFSDQIIEKVNFSRRPETLSIEEFALLIEEKTS